MSGREDGIEVLTVSVLLADDHARTRAMVRRALEESGDFRGVREANDAATAVEGAKRENPDVCLLDINMPGNGISAAAEISGALPDTAVVMLTVSRQDDDLFDALRAGASGYLSKGLDEGRSGMRYAGFWQERPPCPGRSSRASSTSSAIGSNVGWPCPTGRPPASPGGNGTCWS